MLKHTVEEIVLGNGSRGLLIDVPDASVMTCDISFRAGDWFYADENPTKWETAHIMEHLSYGTNKHYKDSRLFKAEFEKNGAYYNASTGQIDMTYTMECADFEWERILDLTKIAITEPIFTTEEFEAECGNVYQELVGRGNNHSSRLALEMDKTYGLNIRTWQERIELVKNVIIEDIKAHYENTHFAENMRFVVAGNLSGRKEKLKSFFENFGLPTKGVDRLEPSREMVTPTNTPLFIKNKTVPNAYFYIDTYVKRELSIQELYALGTLNVILTDTLYSKIFGEARSKGLVYYLSSSYHRNPDFSGMWFGSQIDEPQLLPLIDIIVKEIKAIKAGKLTTQDVDMAHQYQLGGFQRGAQTVGSILSGYAGLYFYNGKISDYYTNFEKLVLGVDIKSVVDITNEMFIDKLGGLGFLGTISEKSRTAAYKKLSTLWQ